MLTPEMVAERYDVSKDAVMRKVRSGELPHYLVLGRVRFEAAELPERFPDRRRKGGER